jgi:3'(2'), 5'-bisphosphate nucleotidase
VADYDQAPMLEQLIRLARDAGEEVLAVYEHGCESRTKADGSPVTEADERAQELICAGLAELSPGVPIMAEESCDPGGTPPPTGSFWLVDPLDGTKEFLSRNGEFTVNIALIEEGEPILGVVLAPALGRLFAADRTAALVEDEQGRQSLSARTVPAAGATLVSSRSHGDPEALARFTEGRTIAAAVTAGSSLKFCVVAAGEADLYPRFGRTMEWDTAAGDAIVRAAGGRVTDLDGQPLRYGKPGLENPPFVVAGRS